MTILEFVSMAAILIAILALTGYALYISVRIAGGSSMVDSEEEDYCRDCGVQCRSINGNCGGRITLAQVFADPNHTAGLGWVN